MELVAGNLLSLPLFFLNEQLAQRDLEQPDLVIDITLDDALLAELCINPAPEESACLYIENYALSAISEQFKVTLDNGHHAELQINHGPMIAVLLNTEDEQVFVSPHIDCMPTFDLGLDEAIEE
ncbi:hypothetical protein [Pseudoalteromonas tunicata]|uniref:hypothetical protein n=1 Tax=Pseudoalteromonas tunicata TaxID=314281 RepID=UPI00273E20A3|nr:hypothetical protein [Pseudoalteromonas tunicata]MDP4982716.1 hypothetical protein [Pseudoalteromonas tunicata]